MKINRPIYIEQLLKLADIPLVKIITGVRRSGKSTLLSLLAEALIKKGIDKDRVIYRRYTSFKDAEINDSLSMYKDIQEITKGKGKCYLLLDEVQEIEGWEKVVNSLFEDDGHSLFVTGSNSKLLSGELSTYLSGRYIEIPVYPLSFAEFRVFRNEIGLGTDTIHDYIISGGFPILSTGEFDDDTAHQILYGIYTSIVIRDIQRRHKISNFDLFTRVVYFVVDNMGKTFSASSVIKFLKGQGRVQNVEQIYDYLKWLEEAFVIYKCQRYDVRGREVLATQEKYYLADHSLIYGLRGFRGTDVAAIIENIVYIELRRRGYKVYVGKLYDKEIDFVAEKEGGKERLYVQVCRTMPESSDREISNLKAIKDNYPKLVIVLDDYASDNFDGIRIIPLASFLMINHSVQNQA